MTPPRKLTLAELREGMRVFLDFPDVEASFQSEVDRTVSRILLTEAGNGGRDPVDVLENYLNAGGAAEERLRIITGFSNGSLERIKRIYAAMFPGASWSGIKSDGAARRRIAAFLINPERESTFIPQFIRRNFFLPNNWIELLQDRDYMRAVAQGNMQSKYAVRMGNALEDSVRALTRGAGYAQDKGAAAIVDHKEVDIAIPSASNPRALIMSSYQLTTSSAQSSKANEQTRMYESVRRYNGSRARRNAPDVLFINVIDGGGWLERPNDLQTMWRECDYCFPHSRLDDLKQVLDYCYPLISPR